MCFWVHSAVGGLGLGLGLVALFSHLALHVSPIQRMKAEFSENRCFLLPINSAGTCSQPEGSASICIITTGYHWLQTFNAPYSLTRSLSLHVAFYRCPFCFLVFLSLHGACYLYLFYSLCLARCLLRSSMSYFCTEFSSPTCCSLSLSTSFSLSSSLSIY